MFQMFYSIRSKNIWWAIETVACSGKRGYSCSPNWMDEIYAHMIRTLFLCIHIMKSSIIANSVECRLADGALYIEGSANTEYIRFYHFIRSYHSYIYARLEFHSIFLTYPSFDIRFIFVAVACFLRSFGLTACDVLCICVCVSVSFALYDVHIERKVPRHSNGMIVRAFILHRWKNLCPSTKVLNFFPH